MNLKFDAFTIMCVSGFAYIQYVHIAQVDPDQSGDRWLLRQRSRWLNTVYIYLQRWEEDEAPCAPPFKKVFRDERNQSALLAAPTHLVNIVRDW